MSYKILYKTQGWGYLHTKQGCSTIEVSGKGDPKMTEKKFESVKIEFSFAEKWGEKELENLKKKVTTWAGNAPFESTISVFPTYHEIQFVVTFDVTDKYYAQDQGAWANSKLQRLIDSHKQPATCQWGTSVWLSHHFGKQVA